MHTRIFLSLFYISSVISDAFLRIPLRKVRTGSGMELSRHILSNQGGPSLVKLQNVKNCAYYGEISVGTPEQKLRILFDTGSADLVVFCGHCVFMNMDCSFLRMHNVYESQNSKTYQANGTTVELEYDDRTNLTGFLSSDVLNVRKKGGVVILFTRTHILVPSAFVITVCAGTMERILRTREYRRAIAFSFGCVSIFLFARENVCSESRMSTFCNNNIYSAI